MPAAKIQQSEARMCQSSLQHGRARTWGMVKAVTRPTSAGLALMRTTSPALTALLPSVMRSKAVVPSPSRARNAACAEGYMQCSSAWRVVLQSRLHSGWLYGDGLARPATCSSPAAGPSGGHR